jgi:hypothetical protein
VLGFGDENHAAFTAAPRALDEIDTGGGDTVRSVRVLPLRPEQEAEPLALRRYQELITRSSEELWQGILGAARAAFSTAKTVRYHARLHGPEVGVGRNDTEAYLALAADIQANPERLFSGYYGTETRPAVLQWVFARDNLMVIVGIFDDKPVLTTFYRATMRRGSAEAISLDTYLKDREHGRQLVEILLR